MASSLRERLRAAAPVSKPQTPRAVDCYLRESVTPLEAFSLPEAIAGETLFLLQGRDYPDCRREDILFLDTETTGLSHGAGTVAFLVGLGFFAQDGFHVRQYMMRDYDEEPFLLQAVAQALPRFRVLCTFNGLSFDMPLLEARFTMQRMRMTHSMPHVDLLHTARRVWKLRLRRCNLTALEEAVLGMERTDDLPGALVPERYFQYLKTHDFSLLEDVLRHNAQDIVSLAHIMSRLMTLHAAPLSADEPEDLLSLGCVMEKRGRDDLARVCYRAADRDTLSAMARLRLAESYRRSGEWNEAAQVYNRMIACRQGAAYPMVAMAKICEHKTRDIARALDYTKKAILYAADDLNADMGALQKRYQRLLYKARRKKTWD